MLANKSIRYMTRENIGEMGQEITVDELKDFLDRLIMGRCRNFTVTGLYLKNTVQELRYYLDILIKARCDAFPFVDLHQKKITHYTLNGHDSTLHLD